MSTSHRPVLVLALVALAYAAAQLIVGVARVPLDLDEAVYLSQFSPRVPAIPYAAHRSPGEALAAAPVVPFTSSVTVIRVYFAALSALLLFLAFLPWLKVLRGMAAPLAAALFAFTWPALRFGGAVLPNQLVAIGAVAAVGLLVRDSRLGLALVVAALTLLRPTDAVTIALVLLVAALVLRRTRTAASICLGLAAGGLWWVIEAYARFGGPATRLRAISSVNQTEGLHFELLRYWATVSGGKETCLPSTAGCGPISPAAVLWWAGGAALVVLGLVMTRHRRPVALCAITAAFSGAAYLVLSDWAVPRYLLPVFALLSVPAAEGLMALVRSGRPAVRVLAWAAAFAAFLHVDFQLVMAKRAADQATAALTPAVRAAGALRRDGVDGHCAVIGRYAPQIAFDRACHAADMRDGVPPRDAHNDLTTANVERLRRRGLRVVIAASPADVRSGAPVAAWRELPVPGSPDLRLYLSPGR
ncbi:hypothetical protein [Spirillospora sp. NPDC047279]|uniref:hypothetical protein n=1 Tax=Spirillospora sp. NPDC047279 TaxID=3155478 RepID=UPI0033E1FD91